MLADFLKTLNLDIQTQDLYEWFEFHFKKMSSKQSLPIQIGFAVYQFAKLRMLEFYYDYIDYYMDQGYAKNFVLQK